MTQQPEALILASWLYGLEYAEAHDAADELRRLHEENKKLLREVAALSANSLDDHREIERLSYRLAYPDNFVSPKVEELRAVNAQLLEALEDLLQDTQHDDHICEDLKWCPVVKARAAIAAAKGEA